MHIAIVGAGVLGSIYGARLSSIGERVTFVVRPERVAERSDIVIQRVKSEQRTVVSHPRRSASVPSDADMVLFAVRFDQIEGEKAQASLRDVFAETTAPVVVLTPLLPQQQAALEAVVGRPVVLGMPGVVGYRGEEGVIHYWVPLVASTLIDEPPSRAETIDSDAREVLARRLTKAGLVARLERDVGSSNAATTTAFFPLIAAIDAGGGVQAALEDRELVDLVLAAANESADLARRLGKLVTWATLLTRFVGPFTLRAGVKLAERLYPETVQFVDVHFGAKLHGQHLAMGDAILRLAHDRGSPAPNLERLMDLVRARG